MSYIDLINQFWRMNRIEPFTPTEVCLYFYLLSQWNNKERNNIVEIKTRDIEREKNNLCDQKEIKRSRPDRFQGRRKKIFCPCLPDII